MADYLKSYRIICKSIPVNFAETQILRTPLDLVNTNLPFNKTPD